MALRAFFRIRSSTIIKIFAALCGFQFMFAVAAFALTSAGGSRVVHAVLGMALGLYLLWIFLFGWFTYRKRDAFKRVFAGVPLGWRTKFVISAILLAMLEEAVTTAMTNTAPLYDMKIGEAYITASANYLDVILGNSVIIFAPMFVAWAWLLSRYRFSANHAFIVFGLTGTIAEVLYGGPQHILEIGMWMFVYGLMIYLPAYSIPERPLAREPKPRHFIFALLLPFPSIILIGPLMPLIHELRPSTLVKFPPMQP